MKMGGSNHRSETEIAALVERVDQGEISATEAARGPIVRTLTLNHAHTRKQRVKSAEQLKLL